MYGFGGFNGAGSENGDGSQRAAVFTSEGKASYLNSVHRSHTTIALDILNDAKNPALTLQEIMTIIMQMSFYDFLQQFDVSSLANCTISSDVEIPVQWNGFATVMILLLLHFSLVLIFISLVLRRIELSLLGNAWQAVAHSLRRSIAIQHVSEPTDGEIGKLMKQSGMAEGRFIVKKSVANGHGEGVFVDYTG